MNRTRAYRRYKDFTKAKRKADILCNNRGWKREDISPNHLGQLRKGKVHCSCGMCQGYNDEVADAKWGRLKKQANEDIEEYYKGRY